MKTYIEAKNEVRELLINKATNPSQYLENLATLKVKYKNTYVDVDRVIEHVKQGI